jgi:hypothetical protein
MISVNSYMFRYLPKHVGVDTYHELHYMICTLLYIIE